MKLGEYENYIELKIGNTTQIFQEENRMYK